MKKILIALLTIISLILFHLSTRYVVNEIYISMVNSGNYDNTIINYLLIFNYPETYVIYYNKGNIYYKKEMYNDAIEEYKKALKTVSKKRVCLVRNNMALSYIKLLNLQKSSLLEDIEFIQKILLENNCASTDLISGKNDNSQEIYNELEELKRQVNPVDPDNPTDPTDPNNPNEPTSKEKELEKQLNEQKIQTQKERGNNERNEKSLQEYDPTIGKTW